MTEFIIAAMGVLGGAGVTYGIFWKRQFDKIITQDCPMANKLMANAARSRADSLKRAENARGMVEELRRKHGG